MALTDSAGNTIETYAYDVYGRPGNSSNVENPYFFTARRFDTLTGLYYYRARYYSPTLGRFLQTDPIGYEGGMSLYTYCWNNPLNWIDPWGFCGEVATDTWIVETDTWIKDYEMELAGGRWNRGREPYAQDDYENILDRVRRNRNRRPSIKDDPEWEGYKKRPKSHKIWSTEKSKRRSQKAVEDNAKKVAVAGGVAAGAVATYAVVEKVVAPWFLGTPAAPVAAALLVIPP